MRAACSSEQHVSQEDQGPGSPSSSLSLSLLFPTDSRFPRVNYFEVASLAVSFPGPGAFNNSYSANPLSSLSLG